MAKFIEMKEKDGAFFPEITDVYPKNGRDFKLSELKGFLDGGYIEIVQLNAGVLKKDLIMIVDDDGKLKGLPENPVATFLYNMGGGTDTIVGNALVCYKEQVR